MRRGNEDWAARFTGNLSWVVQMCLVAGAVLLAVDRRNKRAAERARVDVAGRGQAGSPAAHGRE